MSDLGKTKELAHKQILDLRCSLCQDVPGHLGTRKNRYVCQNGHMVCELCKVRDCICKSNSYNGPVKYIEKLMEQLPWHCCHYFKNGCQDVIDSKSLEDHQKCCIYREINCVFDNCKKQVLFKDFFDHAEACHQDLNEATKMDGKTFIVSFDSSDRATIRFEVPNFTQLKEETYSKATLLSNIPWKISISPNNDGKNKYLSYHLECGVKSDTVKDWSCQAKAELKLINHKDPNATFKREISHLFSSEEDWGFDRYQFWTNVTDLEKGFIKDNTATFEVKLEADPPTGLNPKRPKSCGSENCGVPTKLETSDATFFLVRQKQCDTLRFWVYFIGSALEAKNYSITMSIADNAGKQKYDFQGEVFTLDIDEPFKGTMFMMDTEAAKKILDKDSKIDVKITVRNLKEEAKDVDESSGVSDGSD